MEDINSQIITLTNRGGMKIQLTDFGATWLSCILPLKSGERDVLLGAPSLSALSQQQVYLGATVGRFANRIANGKFTLEGEEFTLTINQAPNCLHGGIDNFSYRQWKIEKKNQNEVLFSLFSPDGDQGFPGDLQASVEYCLTDDNRVTITYTSQTNKHCPVSLTNHSYFNLAGENSTRTCLEHDLQLYAPQFLPLTAEGIPTGEWRKTTGTHFDFSQRRRIGRDFLQDDEQRRVGGYDHPLILDIEKTDGQSIIASLFSPDDDVRLDIATTMPSMQLYSGNYLQGTRGKSSKYTNYFGVAMETQFLPDGPNHPEWDEKYRGIQQANKTYHHSTSYQFIF